ncbi:HEAT repeat domain-containing protein [Labilithrix luteola]|nr:HEAT repeat domain-containing protein [Labilithrix luteola]
MMRSTIKTTIALGALLGSFFTMGQASANPGLAIDGSKVLPVNVSSTLRAEISRGRTADAGSFHAVNDLVARSKTIDARARGGKAAISHALAKLGPTAVMPMIELLAFDGPAGLPVEQSPAVQRDLVEALGLLRDPRAMPVLGKMLERDADFTTTRTVAEAIARMDTDEASQKLVSSLATSSGERAKAILAGMGMCHKTVVTQTLAARLAARPDDATAILVVKSLGHAGNAWGWKTLADRTDENEVRGAAAKALVDAYVTYTGSAREAAAKALLVVDAPNTSSLIQNAKSSASPEARTALDALATRVAHNPTR